MIGCSRQMIRFPRPHLLLDAWLTNSGSLYSASITSLLATAKFVLSKITSHMSVIWDFIILVVLSVLVIYICMYQFIMINNVTGRTIAYSERIGEAQHVCCST